MSKPKLSFREFLPHGSICYECAIDKGGVMPAGNCNTVSLDTCPYCEEEKGTLSISDFDWPAYRRGHVWD